MSEVNLIDPWMVVSDIRTNQEKRDRITALSERIKPVVLRNGALRPVLHDDVFNSSFVWDYLVSRKQRHGRRESQRVGVSYDTGE